MRKQILILGHNYATQFIDIFNQYTRLFEDSKYEVTIVFLSGKACTETKNRLLAKQVFFLDCPKGSLRYLKIGAMIKVERLLSQKKFDLVICHRYKPTFIMLWLSLFYKMPVIGVMHELGTMASRGRQFLVALLANKRFLFAGVSNAVRDDMRRDLWSIPAERIITLYNMIDTELTEPLFFNRQEARNKFNFKADDFVFGHIARLARNKDQASLITAFAQIKKVCPNAKLIIIGDGRLEDELKAQTIKLAIQDDVIFTGFLPGGFRYLKGFDCFVLPSIQEAFGRVLIEAMLAKLPIITTNVNGIPEVMADHGTLVPAGDVDALAFAMEQIYLCSLAKRQLMGEYAYEHVKRNFSIPCFYEQFWKLELVQDLKGIGI